MCGSFRDTWQNGLFYRQQIAYTMRICTGIDRAKLQECAIGVSPFSFLNELYFLYCAGIKPSLVATAFLVEFLASP